MTVEVALSQQITEARLQLLEILKSQLDGLITEQLKPQEQGVPFIDFAGDPPPAVAIKKVMNCLYHAEEGLKIWEKISEGSLWDKAKAAPQGVSALLHVYKALAMLDDATPEIRWIITENYHVLAPIFSQTYEVVKESGWLSEFIAMDTTDKASNVIDQGLDFLGPDLEKWNESNPLISTFAKISQVMETMTLLQSKTLTEQEKQKAMKEIDELLTDLDNNAFIHQLKLSDFEDSKVIDSLLGWFQNIQEDGFDFTKKSLEQYVDWSNVYLPKLVLIADQLERQNYLKSGLLSADLCSKADDLSRQINEVLDSDTVFNISDRVVTTELLIPSRDRQIEASQIKCVRTLLTLEKQQSAAAEFFKILEVYKGQSFAAISEPDRVLLRQLYPQLQMTLAHADLGLENKFTINLNKPGPEEHSARTKSWWQMTKDGVGYVTNFVINSDVDNLLKTKEFVGRYTTEQIESEQFKITIAEKARQKLLSPVRLDKNPSKEEITKRIEVLKKALGSPDLDEIIPEVFTPVKPSELSNLRGTLAYFQEMNFSVSVKDTRDAISTLISRHLAEEDQAYFSTTPYVINENEPVIVVQIKKIENSLFELETALKNFEKSNLNYGVAIHLQSYLAIAGAANQVKKSVASLAPDTQKILASVLPQVTGYGSTLSDTSHQATDLPALGQLKQDETLAVDEPEIKQVTEKEESAVDTSLDKLAYAKQIKEARTSLLSKLQSSLSQPLSTSLTPQTQGVPFINIENDPPQVAAIKKMINSMYYAESALTIWHNIDTKNDSHLGKIAAAHQGVAALSQVYKSFELFTDATPEVQNLIIENNDLIQPILDGAKGLIAGAGWTRQFDSLGFADTIGSILGRGVKAIQPGSDSQTSSIVHMLSELPSLMNDITTSLRGEEDTSIDTFKISEDRITAISQVLEVLFEENSSSINLLKGPKAISGLLELSNNFSTANTELQTAWMMTYQQWLKKSYPDLLAMLDEVESRYYLKPGTLSAPITLEIDRISDKLNEKIKSYPQSTLKPIELSFDLADKRVMHFIKRKEGHYLELFQLEDQEKAALVFFDILNKYAGKSFLDIDPSDRAELRNSFAIIQLDMANSNLDVANKFVHAFNQLETNPPEQWKGIDISIDQVLKQKSSVHKHLLQRQKSIQLKIDVVDHAIEHINAQNYIKQPPGLKENSRNNLKENYLSSRAHQIKNVQPGELKITETSSLHSVRGNISYIQNLKLSSQVELMREQLKTLTQTGFSDRLLKHLEKPESQPLHLIKENDPKMVRQIKEIENGLYHLETALNHFENMRKDDNLVTQVRALIEITTAAQQLNGVLKDLLPELKEHYGPVTANLIQFAKAIKSIDYNRQDWNDLLVVLDTTKKELLKRETPQDPRITKAFFEYYGHKEPEAPGVIPESAIKKGLRLGVKYTHLASPQLEMARQHLHTRYPTVFGEQPYVIRSFTRAQLADEHFMTAAMDKIKSSLEKNYGFNPSTLKVMLDLIKQTQRAGVQSAELTGMANKLVTDDFIAIKKRVYKALIAELSAKEDDLCLKPGTLIDPVMTTVNQLFLSAALEIDMPFNNKLALFDDKRYINKIIDKINQDIALLDGQLIADPDNENLKFQIDVKKDKLDFLTAKIKSFNANEIKGDLLDMQFEVFLRNHLNEQIIKKPIVEQYEAEVRKHYEQHKNDFLAAEDCEKSLPQSLKDFEKNHIGNYIIVYEAYRKLHNFSLKLPAKNQDVKDYIVSINQEITNGKFSIQDRASRVLNLPNDITFVSKLSSSDKGTGFLRQFAQFIERAVTSIIESATSGQSITYIYQQKKIDQSIKNIERTIDYKEELNTIKQEDNKPEDDNDLIERFSR